MTRLMQTVIVLALLCLGAALGVPVASVASIQIKALPTTLPFLNTTNLYLPAGTASNASIQFGSSTAGLFAGAGDSVSVTAGNSERTRTGSGGFFLMNNTPILYNTDNGADLGALAANRPRTGYFATSLFSPLFTSPAATAISALPGAASGADQAGADFTASGGQSTGAGAAGNFVIKAAVHAAGTASSVNGLHTVATFRNLHQGGAFTMPRSTGDAPQPGSGNATFYLVCGANPGTLALVVKSGTNNTHAIVTNNIGSGNSGC